MGLLQEILGRLAQTGQNIHDNTASGPYQYIQNKVPEPLRGVADASMAPQNALFQILSMGADASGQVAKTATGAGLMGLGAINAAMGGQPDDIQNAVNTVIDRNAPDIQSHGGVNLGDLVGLARQTNEEVARKHSFLTGAANLALDPSNLLTPAAEATGLISHAPAYAASTPKLSEMVEALNQSLSTSGRAALKRQLSAMKGIDLQRLSPSAIMGDWKAQLVNKPRNPTVQDNMFNAAMARANNMPLGDVADQYVSMSNNVAAAEAAGIDAKDVLPSRVGGFLAAHGKDNVDFTSLAGAGLIDSGATQKAIHPLQSAALQVAYGAANPKRLGLGLAMAPIDAAIGYVRPGMNEFLGQMGHINQTSFRAPAVERGIGEYFSKRGGEAEFNAFATNLKPAEETAIFKAAAQRMADFTNAGENLAVYGDKSKYAFITPQDIFEASGDAGKLRALKSSGASDSAIQKFLDTSRGNDLANEWSDVIDAAIEYGGVMSKKVYGDFSKPGGLANNILPFMGWVKQAYPRIFQAALKEPSLLATITHGMTMSANHIKNTGAPDYVMGQIPVSTEAPGVGAVASAFLGGRKGTAYIDPLGAISPVGGDTLSGLQQDNSQKTPVDQGLDLLNTLGLPGVNPLIAYALYASGQSDKVPGNLSGYSGFEQAAPGPEVVPSLTNGIITAARKAVGKYGPSDPYELAAMEKVFQQTGKPIDDPSNRHFAVDIAQKQGVYQEAKADVDAGAAERSLIQFVDPFNVTAVTDQAEQRAKASADVKSQMGDKTTQIGRPDLAGKSVKEVGQTEPNVAMALATIQAQLQQANPASRMYNMPQLAALETQDPRLTAWQYAHFSESKLNPKAYTEKEKAFKQTLGIK